MTRDAIHIEDHAIASVDPLAVGRAQALPLEGRGRQVAIGFTTQAGVRPLLGADMGQRRGAEPVVAEAAVELSVGEDPSEGEDDNHRDPGLQRDTWSSPVFRSATSHSERP